MRLRSNKSSKRIAGDKDWLVDILQAVGLAVDFINDVAKLAPVPYISPAVELLVSIFETINAIQDNKGAMERLQQDSVGLLAVICQSRASHNSAIPWPPPEIQDRIEEIMKILKEISEFAAQQRSRGLWSRVISSKVDPVEVQEKRERIQGVLEKFKLQSHININVKLSELISSQIMADISARELAFDVKRSTVLEKLERHTAPGASHNSSAREDLPKCLPNTREAMLGKVTTWLENPDGKSPILWVHSPVGFGKTTLAHTIADSAEKSGHLGASFFWSHWSSNCPTTSTQFVTTISYQLCKAQNSQLFTEQVIEAVEQDPGIFNLALPIQMDRLVANPLARVFADKYYSNPLIYLLLVIDGLDECEGNDSRKAVLRLLLSAAQKNLSTPLRILICSRYEPDIRSVLEDKDNMGLIIRAPLERDHTGMDVKTYILSQFMEIKKNHPTKDSLSPSWPSDPDVDVLIKKSDGVFIHASVIMKYIGSEDHHPEMILKEVITSPSFRGTSAAYANLDAVYIFLLRKISPHNMKKARELLAWIIIDTPADVQYKLKTVPFVETLLDLKSGETRIVLKALASVIDIPDHPNHNSSLRFFHVSFADMLTNRERLGDLADVFLYDSLNAHTEVAKKWIAYYYQNHISNLELQAMYTDEYASVLIRSTLTCILYYCYGSIGLDGSLDQDLHHALKNMDIVACINCVDPGDASWWSRIFIHIDFLLNLKSHGNTSLDYIFLEHISRMQKPLQSYWLDLPDEFRTYLPMLFQFPSTLAGESSETFLWFDFDSPLQETRMNVFYQLLGYESGPLQLTGTMFVNLSKWLILYIMGYEQKETEYDEPFHPFFNWTLVPEILKYAVSQASNDLDLAVLLEAVILQHSVPGIAVNKRLFGFSYPPSSYGNENVFYLYVQRAFQNSLLQTDEPETNDPVPTSVELIDKESITLQSPSNIDEDIHSLSISGIDVEDKVPTDSSSTVPSINQIPPPPRAHKSSLLIWAAVAPFAICILWIGVKGLQRR